MFQESCVEFGHIACSGCRGEASSSEGRSKISLKKQTRQNLSALLELENEHAAVSSYTYLDANLGIAGYLQTCIQLF